MSRSEVKAFWEEYNKEYGLEMDFPEELVDWLENFDDAEFNHRLAMGDSFDSAMQYTMNF